MNLSYKYRFYPTAEQAAMLSRTFGSVRYVYNFGLALRREAYEERGERLVAERIVAEFEVVEVFQVGAS